MAICRSPVAATSTRRHPRTRSTLSSTPHWTAETFTLRASDRADATNEVQTRVELTIVGTDEDDLRRIFDGLSQGGTVKAPLEKMFWGDIFGALIDKFGIGWQVNITAS